MKSTFVLLVVMLIAAAGCSSSTEDKGIVQQVQILADGSVDFSGVSVSEWQCAFIFAPYRTEDEIARGIGFVWPDYSKTKSANYDEFCLLLFTHHHRVVAWCDVPRNKMDLAEFPQSMCIPRTNPVAKPLQNQVALKVNKAGERTAVAPLSDIEALCPPPLPANVRRHASHDILP